MQYNSANPDGTFSYEKIASHLEKHFNESLSEDRDGKFKKINDIFYENMKSGIKLSRFKIYISELLKDINIRSQVQNEVTALKRARKNIGSIITTNYDMLVENLFDFNPLVGNDILLSNPYGSVYKIHGCVTQPDKIIISQADYTSFNQKYELIRAQLLALFIHHPIIFVGYNIGDENIRKLLKTIFTYVSPNSDIAEKIQANFLVVEFEKDSNNLEVYAHDIVLEDMVTIHVHKIKTDNFLAIYNALATIKLPVSALDIRKVQSIVKDIYEGGNIRVSIVNDIDNLKNEEKVLAIGNIKHIHYEYQATGEMMENYFRIIEEDNSQLLKLIEKHKIQESQFFPIFAFSEINSTLCCASKLKEQQRKKLKTILEKIDKKYITDASTISQILSDDNISSTNKSDVILCATLKGKLDLEDVKEYLLNLKQSLDNKANNQTNYRKILCAYDFMKYSEDKTL